MSFVEENFKMLFEIGECIARQFGEDCEVVLHDLTKSYDNSIVAIWNGHVTGRKVGGGGTDAGLAILNGMTEPKDEYCYINTTKDGKILRSSSKYFVDKDGKVSGSLCINFDITGLVMAQNTMAKLTKTENNKNELFTSNIDELLEGLMKEAVESTGHTMNTLELLEKEDKVAIVKYLDDKGAFLIKKTAEKVADFLNVSRFTVYNYLNEGKVKA